MSERRIDFTNAELEMNNGRSNSRVMRVYCCFMVTVMRAQ